jgi:hypothetical protein
MLRMYLEASHPLQMPVAWHFRHVVPGGVTCEGEEVEVLAGEVNGSFQRALRVADGVVVVEVTPVETVLPLLALVGLRP